MLEPLIPATMEDLDAIWQMYVDVCEQQAHDAYGPRWTLGVYPTREDVAAHIAAGELYVALLDGQMAGAMALVCHEDPEYAEVPWTTPAAPDEVAVIHLLCVPPRARGHRLGLFLTQEAVRLARAAGKQVIHLDVVPGNLVASRIYESVGFVHVCDHEIFYEDTGLMAFEMYEYVL